MSTHRRGTSPATLGSVQGLVLFNISVSDADNGMECKHSKFVDNIEPSSAKITTEGTPFRRTMTCQKAQLRWGISKVEYSVISALRADLHRRTQGYLWMKNYELAMWACYLGSQSYIGLLQDNSDQYFLSLLCPCRAPLAASQLWGTQHKKGAELLECV